MNNDNGMAEARVKEVNVNTDYISNETVTPLLSYFIKYIKDGRDLTANEVAAMEDYIEKEFEEF